MLTKKQKELFVFLNDYIGTNDICPSFEEMKNAVNLKSKSGIHRLITSLEQRGYIKRLKHRARAMEITKDLPNKNTNSNSQNNYDSYLNIPLVGSIAAGEAIEAINSQDSMISVPKSLLTKNSCIVFIMILLFLETSLKIFLNSPLSQHLLSYAS